MRIVIVEDEMKIRTGMARLISTHTAHVIVGEAKNGREGLEIIQKFHPDLVISDIRMPVMDGLEMLAEMRIAGIHCHCVILSGYSEFEYAQKAIQYGVEAYLLKPLAPEDVIQVLESVQLKMDEIQKQQGETKEGLLRNILLGGNTGQKKDLELLKKLEMYPTGTPCFLTAVYVGDTGVGYEEQISQIWGRAFFRERKCRCDSVLLENLQQVFCLIQGEVSEEELCREISRLAYRMLKEDDMPVWALSEMKDLTELSETKERLLQWQGYGMILGYRQILTEKVIRSLEIQEYSYPKQLEGMLQNAICRENGEYLAKLSDEFIKTVKDMACEPRHMKRIYQKMVHFIGNVLQETDSSAYKAVEDLDIEKQINQAVTIGELEKAFSKLTQTILEVRDKKEDIRNYAILKAINYIKENFRENISLDQLAEYLEMTPEYLSTLFNREMGINFTTFLKQFRISHAKRLLKGTGMKIYEIASEVGYHDPKYFNRVFKEVTGISPGDYRQQS